MMTPDSPRYIETVPRRGYRLIMAGRTRAGIIKAPSWHVSEQSIIDYSRSLPLSLSFWLSWDSAWRLALWHDDASTSPQFQRPDFDLPELGGARFTSDGPRWCTPRDGIQIGRYLCATVRRSGPQLLGIADSALLAVSPQAELAVVSEDPDSELPMTHMGMFRPHWRRVPLNGGAPRELLPAARRRRLVARRRNSP